MAFICVLVMALALGSSTVWSSHPFESARNQYEAGEDRPRPPQLLTEATDRPEVHHFNSIKKSTENNRKSAIPELQVGCGDGFIQEKDQKKSEVDKNKVIKRRRRRSFTPWSGQVIYSHPYQSLSAWNPPVYQLSRPYYIPIYGVAGKPPIYYPPQPLLINPGVPAHNPVKYKGPSYLPPKPETTSKMTLTDRFNGGDNEDDRPIWDLGGGNQITERPSTTTAVIPTRRTRRPGAQKTHPPLIHNPVNGATTPRPSVEEEQYIPPAPTSPPQRPVRPQRPARPNEPSRCVWAIISCCSTTNQISYDCFDQRGCPGAFWDRNPCDSDFAKAAIAAALNYYEGK